MTIFATAPKSLDETALQQMEDAAQREATYKSVADGREGKGEPQALPDNYYVLMAWIGNYMCVLIILFGELCPLLVALFKLRAILIITHKQGVGARRAQSPISSGVYSWTACPISVQWSTHAIWL